MLTLDQRRFDQDMTGGWQALEFRGCEEAAADLVHRWRAAHHSRDPILFWHEGQLRADLGQNDRALALFEKARKTPAQDAGMSWNLYVDGTVAFLRHDRPALDTARARLAALPKPANLAFNGPDGKPMAIAWPLNLNVLDWFERCWGQPYKATYACATPLFRRTLPDPAR